jgi:hypothetical protein
MLGICATPPVMSTPPYRSLRTSTSQRPMTSSTSACSPLVGASAAAKRLEEKPGKEVSSSGWNSSSGTLNLSAPT